MPGDTLVVFGNEYDNVAGIKAYDDNGQLKTYIRPQGTKSIASNGTGIDVTAYAAVDVAVPGQSPTLQSKTKTYTPTESQQTETVAADSGYDGLSEVSVTVNAVSSSYVGSGITRRSSSDLTASGATVTAPAGYYSSNATKTVASGTEGTPSATKGTVSNNSVSVTPSVTNTAGYISGGTKTGTAVTVSASELVSGTKTITENGTGIDVTNYASVDVNVSGGGGTTWTTLYDGNSWINSSSPNYVLFNNYTTPFLQGETYRVTWGSDTFIYETDSDGGQSYDGYYIGNPGIVGGTDDGSGATFFIYRDRADRAVAATTDASGNKYVKIEKQVSSGGGNYQTKTGITPTTSSQTITADSGYDALESVQINAMPTGTAGTPTATKGTVSNHAISVTPSVTNTTGYITGGTKTGTAVSVTASELASGNKEITANGTNIDVVGYSTVSVAVPSSGSSKNVQTAQSTTRRNNTSLGSINSLTCSTAGTYEVYWTCARSNTSQTWGSQLYINGVAHGTENTTWTNNVQNNHSTGITLAKNDTVAVYGRSRSGYYIYAPQLTIIQTA